MHRMVKGLAAIAMVAVTASAAQAQVKFGAHLGAGMPTGTFGDYTGTGFQVGGELGIKPAMLPVGLRVDADFTQFGLDEAAVGAKGNFRVLSGTANVILRIPSAMITPYLLAGGGMYRGQANVDGADASESSTDAGFQVGGGLELNLAGMATALELKLVNVMTEGEASRYVPITFRIMFGK